MKSKVAFLLLLAVIAARTAVADGVVDGRLRLSVEPQFGAFRGQSPLAVRATLSWSDPVLLEGRLRLKWYVAQTHLGTYISPETALADSSFKRSILLPPAIMPDDVAAFSVQGEFVTRDQVYDLDIHDLAVPLDWRRTFVVGLLRPPGLRMEASGASTEVPGRVRFIQSLRFEQFIETPLRARELSTMVVEVDPDDVPTDPLQLMGFDILVIPGESLGKLSEPCLESLVTWVEAGGSLCCLIDGPLPERHVAFVNRLAGDGPAEAPYLQTEAGRLLPVAGEATGIDHHRPALGRLVVARGVVDYGSEDWQRAMLFLWKVRRERIADWEQGREWPLDPIAVADDYNAEYLLPLSLEPNRPLSVGPMTAMLLPQSIQGLPLLTIGAILALFLLVIAPGDYFLLGWLRRRRWTWVLFPAMSLLFTWLTMGLAERHLGSANLGRSITIVDLSSDGRPVRVSRIDLLFSAFNQTVRDQQRRSLMVPVDPETKESTAARMSVRGYSPDYEEPWTYIGNLPGRHVVERTVRQWSPRLSRTTTLGSPAPPSDATLSSSTTTGSTLADSTLADSTLADSPLAGFDWQSVTRERLTQPDGLRELWRALREYESSADVVVLGDTRDVGFGQVGDVEPEQDQGHATQRSAVSRFIFANSTSRTEDSRLFTLVSQVSPTAAGQWEDLAILDSSDDRAMLVVAVTEPTEGQYVAYRKLLIEEK